MGDPFVLALNKNTSLAPLTIPSDMNTSLSSYSMTFFRMIAAVQISLKYSNLHFVVRSLSVPLLAFASAMLSRIYSAEE